MSPCISLRQTDGYTQRPRHTYTARQGDCSVYATLFMLYSLLVKLFFFSRVHIIAFTVIPLFILLFSIPLVIFTYCLIYLFYAMYFFSYSFRITPTHFVSLILTSSSSFPLPAYRFQSLQHTPHSHCEQKACEFSHRVRQHEFASTT